MSCSCISTGSGKLQSSTILSALHEPLVSSVFSHFNFHSLNKSPSLEETTEEILFSVVLVD